MASNKQFGFIDQRVALGAKPSIENQARTIALQQDHGVALDRGEAVTDGEESQNKPPGVYAPATEFTTSGVPQQG
jgi:hypothetical protein